MRQAAAEDMNFGIAETQNLICPTIGYTVIFWPDFRADDEPADKNGGDD